MEIDHAKNKTCWRSIGGAEIPIRCLADECMGWEPEMRLATSLIETSDQTPDGWHEKGIQMSEGRQMKLIGKYKKTTRGWCDALPKGVE